MHKFYLLETGLIETLPHVLTNKRTRREEYMSVSLRPILPQLDKTNWCFKNDTLSIKNN